MTTAIQTLLANHAALVGVFSMVAIITNILLSTVQQILAALHKTLPSGLVSVSNFVQKVVAWMSANTATPVTAQAAPAVTVVTPPTSS